MDEARLFEKLARIEALYAGATTDGERVAAGLARERILARLREVEALDPPVEYRFSLGDVWSRRVFLALLRRYEIRPYRYPRQRRTTVMARVSRRFVDETLWPEYQEIDKTLRAYLSEVTDRVVREVLSGDGSEADVVEEQPQLPLQPAGGAPGPKPEPKPAPEPPPKPEPKSTPAPPPSGRGRSGSGKKSRKKKKKRKRR